MCRADWLSQLRVTGVRLLMPSSWSNLTIHVTSEAACAIALYSASEELLETVPCFFDFQLMGEDPKRIKYPITDLLEVGKLPSLNQRRLVDLVELNL